MALRVIPVVPDDVAPQVVIIGVDPGHDVKSGIRKDANPAPRTGKQQDLALSTG